MHRSRRHIVQTLVFSRSYLHCQVSPPEIIIVKGGNTWARNGRWILLENVRLPHNIQGSFTCRKSTTWDKRCYFPSEGRRAEDFFALKNPTASAGFKPVNLGAKGQHSNSRPPKPLCKALRSVSCQIRAWYVERIKHKYSWLLWDNSNQPNRNFPLFHIFRHSSHTSFSSRVRAISVLNSAYDVTFPVFVIPFSFSDAKC